MFLYWNNTISRLHFNFSITENQKWAYFKIFHNFATIERASPHKMVKPALSPIRLKLIQNVSLDEKPPKKIFEAIPPSQPE